MRQTILAANENFPKWPILVIHESKFLDAQGSNITLEFPQRGLTKIGQGRLNQLCPNE